jgi:hypothetical protein
MSQHPVDREGVGVGRYLGRDPGRQPNRGARQRRAQAEYPLQAGDGDLHSLPHPAPPLGWLRHQEDVHLGQGLQGLLRPHASVGKVPQEPPRYSISQGRLLDELRGQGDIGHVGRGEFVAQRDPIGGADEVQLHPVDAERTPPHPRRSRETRALRDLPGVQNREQSRVDQQRLRVADHLGEDVTAQGLQKAQNFARLTKDRVG